MNLSLDHVGILGAEVDDLVETFSNLGFMVIGPAGLDTGDDSKGVQRSAHIMFRDSYIELTSVREPTPEHHLGPYLQCPQGLRLLLLACESAERGRDSVCEAGLHPTKIYPASRSLDYGDGGVARFCWFGLEQPVLEDVLVGWVEHRDRERVFHESVIDHPNTVRSIDAILAGCALPAALASDTAPVEWRNLGKGPVMQGLVLRVSDMRSVTECLDQAQIPHELIEGSVSVDPHHAAGVRLLFREGL